MAIWEIRKVSGQGFLNDDPIAAYQDLDATAIEDLKVLHEPLYTGRIEEFVSLSSVKKSSSPERELTLVPTCWEGRILPVGTIYCVIVDWEKQSAPQLNSLGSLGLSPSDRMVQVRSNQFQNNARRSSQKGAFSSLSARRSRRTRAQRKA